MPWATKDVDKHRKGLTDKQKKQWVAIANSVRFKCIKDGGDPTTCDATAIKQANGVVKTASATYAQNIQVDNYNIQTKIYQGKKNLVVPVVMMVEGVHNGSHGPLFHSKQEIAKNPAIWNGIPVVIQHPEKGGQSVSANSPDLIDSLAVGRVYNSSIADNKLKGEVWLQEDKLKQVSPLAYGYIMQQKPLDVSVGVFSDDDFEQAGEWNGETYIATAKNYVPDHLALLPGSAGACSWEDGCGIRVNNASVLDTVRLVETALDGLEHSTNEFPAVPGNANIYYSLEQLFDDGTIIYRKRNMVDGEEKYYKRSYQIENGKVIFGMDIQEVNKEIKYIPILTQGGEMDVNATVTAMEKKRKELGMSVGNFYAIPRDPPSASKLPIFDEAHVRAAMARFNQITGVSAEEKTSAHKKIVTKAKHFNIKIVNFEEGGPYMDKKIKELLTISPEVYAEADKGWLAKLEEAQVDKLLKNAKQSVEVVAEKAKVQTNADALQKKVTALEAEVKKSNEKAPQMNEEAAMKVLKDKISDVKTFAALLPDEMKNQFLYGQKLYDLHRQELIKHITTNQAQKVWDEDSLKAQSDENLQKIADSIKKPVDYSGAHGEFNSDYKGEILFPVGMIKEEKGGK